MDEIRLKKLNFQVRDLSPWESFFSDVLDLALAPTANGLSVQLHGIEIQLKLSQKPGQVAPVEWEFALNSAEKEIILSRWSFLQYRADHTIQMSSQDEALRFQIDMDSSVVVHFDSVHICESLNSDKSAVRNF